MDPTSSVVDVCRIGGNIFVSDTVGALRRAILATLRV